MANILADNMEKFKKASTIPTINGVSGELMSEGMSEFEPNEKQAEADAKKNSASARVESLVNTENIVSKDVTNTLNSSFKVPSAVTKADRYLSDQLKKIQSGKTSYTDDINELMAQIRGREKFSYDVDTDPLFQQALASSMNSGKTAMQDTIGQASALTGGYGSTYATTAGNQAYNSFIEDAYNNLPQYYQMAMNAYQMEGDEMYRQLGMLNDADDKEFNRNVMAYDATYQHRNQMYNEAYSQYRDNKSDAFAMANLQLTEHGQRVSDAYNFYNIAANEADTLYERSFREWESSVNQAWQAISALNSDYWSQTNFDEGVRQYEKNFAENVRQFDTNFAEQQRQYNESLAEQKRQHNEQMAYNYTALNKKSSGGGGGSGGSGGNVKTPTQKMMQDGLTAYEDGGQAGLKKYLASVPEGYDITQIADYASSYGASWVSEYESLNDWNISNDTKNGAESRFLWWTYGDKGDDHNDVYTDSKGQSLTFDDLKEKIDSSKLPPEKKDELLTKYRGQSRK